MKDYMQPYAFLVNLNEDLSGAKSEINSLYLSLSKQASKDTFNHDPLGIGYYTEGSLAILRQTLNEKKHRIRILHYAGHSNEWSMQTDNGELSHESFLQHLIVSGASTTIKLLFLNGCLTQNIANLLVKHQFKGAIIATNRRVDDGTAEKFAELFYDNWTATPKNNNPYSIEQAFKMACAGINLPFEQSSLRDLGSLNSEDTQLNSWQLFGLDETKKLTFYDVLEAPFFKKTEYLTIPLNGTNSSEKLVNQVASYIDAPYLGDEEDQFEYVLHDYPNLLKGAFEKFYKNNSVRSYDTIQINALEDGLSFYQSTTQLLCYILVSAFWQEEPQELQNIGSDFFFDSDLYYANKYGSLLDILLHKVQSSTSNTSVYFGKLTEKMLQFEEHYKMYSGIEKPLSHLSASCIKIEAIHQALLEGEITDIPIFKEVHHQLMTSLVPIIAFTSKFFEYKRVSVIYRHECFRVKNIERYFYEERIEENMTEKTVYIRNTTENILSNSHAVTIGHYNRRTLSDTRGICLTPFILDRNLLTVKESFQHGNVKNKTENQSEVQYLFAYAKKVQLSPAKYEFYYFDPSEDSIITLKSILKNVFDEAYKKKMAMLLSFYSSLFEKYALALNH